MNFSNYFQKIVPLCIFSGFLDWLGLQDSRARTSPHLWGIPSAQLDKYKKETSNPERSRAKQDCFSEGVQIEKLAVKNNSKNVLVEFRGGPENTFSKLTRKQTGL